MFALNQANFDSSSDEDLSAPRSPPPDSEGEVEDKSTPKRGQNTPRIPIVFDAEAVKRLDQVEMSDAAKHAYLKLRTSKPWQRWVESFQSFLPGVTVAQRDWNQRLRQFWERHAKVVWSRYFWIGYGHYGEPGHVADQSANHPKSDLNRANKAWLLLVTDLYRMEGHTVFQYLYVWARDAHPKDFAWCGELFKTAGSQGWAHQTVPFPYVRHEGQGIFNPPRWLREQSTTEKNQTGLYAVLPDHQCVESLSDHSVVAGSDVSGLPEGGSPTSAITL
ncbi:hypothetical protein H310_14636 [Aphanomyces invadans]|uniref:Uncharacterized protein n=1 Tax=Aphanomyces invadans TaxID=157072 RepID=A0A024T8W4_9STRA|nr:hypothetical protein H310_14636 [Aphanomyces invadans]ETV90600.1 hypothetical protein H310_14636 [Aphanomyces invadans]|eukprot:XP_008880753.1 hypothetical protein H310_14636 [Aphanomyces invadans]